MLHLVPRVVMLTRARAKRAWTDGSTRQESDNFITTSSVPRGDDTDVEQFEMDVDEVDNDDFEVIVSKTYSPPRDASDDMRDCDRDTWGRDGHARDSSNHTWGHDRHAQGAKNTRGHNTPTRDSSDEARERDRQARDIRSNTCVYDIHARGTSGDAGEPSAFARGAESDVRGRSGRAWDSTGNMQEFSDRDAQGRDKYSRKADRRVGGMDGDAYEDDCNVRGTGREMRRHDDERGRGLGSGDAERTLRTEARRQKSIATTELSPDASDLKDYRRAQVD